MTWYITYNIHVHVILTKYSAKRFQTHNIFYVHVCSCFRLWCTFNLCPSLPPPPPSLRFHSLLRPSFSAPVISPSFSAPVISNGAQEPPQKLSLSSLKAVLYDELGLSLVSVQTPARSSIPLCKHNVRNLQLVRIYFFLDIGSISQN